MATSSSKKKTGSAKKPAAAPKKQPAKKQSAAAPTPAQTAPTWPYAIVCIVLSLLAFLGLFHAEGVIIDGFAGFLSGIMGWGYWAFPFAMLLLAWVFVRNPERHFGLRVTASLLIAPLFGTIVHLMVCRVPFTAQTFGAIVGQLYDGGKALTSGGVISGGVGYLLKAGISVYAALPLTMAAFVACVLGSMDLTVGKIVTWWRAHREAQYIPDDGDQPLFDDEDEPLYEVKCPTCGDTICVDESMLCEGEIDCPNAAPRRTSLSPRKSSSIFRSRTRRPSRMTSRSTQSRSKRPPAVGKSPRRRRRRRMCSRYPWRRRQTSAAWM